MNWRRSSHESEAHTDGLRRPRHARAWLTGLGWALTFTSLLATPDVASAQRFLGFGGAELRAGGADVTAAKGTDVATNISVESDFGYVGVPTIRSILGFNFFSGDVAGASGPLRPGAEGTMRSAGVAASLRWDWRPKHRLTPYLLAGATLDYVRSDAGDPEVDGRLEGNHLGGQFGGGVAFRFGSEHHHWSLTADLRGVTSQDMGRMLATVGLRYSPRGQAMYDVDDIPSARPTTIIEGPPGRAPPP